MMPSGFFPIVERSLIIILAELCFMATSLQFGDINIAPLRFGYANMHLACHMLLYMHEYHYRAVIDLLTRSMSGNVTCIIPWPAMDIHIVSLPHSKHAS